MKERFISILRNFINNNSELLENEEDIVSDGFFEDTLDDQISKLNDLDDDITTESADIIDPEINTGNNNIGRGLAKTNEYIDSSEEHNSSQIHDRLLNEEELKLRKELYYSVSKKLTEKMGCIHNNRKYYDSLRNASLYLYLEIDTQEKIERDWDDKTNVIEYERLINLAKDIKSMKIYSLRYFDTYVHVSQAYYDILCALFSHEYTYIDSDKKGRPDHYDYEKGINSNINIDELFKWFDKDIENIDKTFKVVKNHIDDVIGAMNIDELYELLKNLKSFQIEKHFFYEEETNYIYEVFMEYIEKRTKQEITARAAASPAGYYPLMNGFVYKMPPEIDTMIKTEEDRMSQWAWQYMLLHGPKDKFSENMKFFNAAVHMADILPALIPGYTKRWRSFDQHYTSPNRKRYFTDQTELYNRLQGKLQFSHEMMGHSPVYKTKDTVNNN